MTKEEIISGLRMTKDLMLFDPLTGETFSPDTLNDIDRITYDSCKGAIEALDGTDTNVGSNGLISRQAAIDAINDWLLDCFKVQKQDRSCGLIRRLEELPSAQSERLTDDDFETIRIHLSAFKEKLSNKHRFKEAEEYQRIIDRFMSFASAQHEITDEQAIEHLQASGWMQRHDKQMYEMGLREHLADDSDSYDALLPPTQQDTMV